ILQVAEPTKQPPTRARQTLPAAFVLPSSTVPVPHSPSPEDTAQSTYGPQRFRDRLGRFTTNPNLFSHRFNYQNR
ncbi:MAG: hypothetical protein ACKPKO_30885, partial [Candidatus Fonsibacter sp.]